MGNIKLNEQTISFHSDSTEKFRFEYTRLEITEPCFDKSTQVQKISLDSQQVVFEINSLAKGWSQHVYRVVVYEDEQGLKMIQIFS